MPSERYRDPDTGRWVSRETGRSGSGNWLTELFDSLTGRTQESYLVSEGRRVSEYGETPEPNWTSEESSRWGFRWKSPYGEALNLEALEDQDFPDDAVAYRIRYFVEDNPDYPRGYGSTDWLSGSEWPPDPTMYGGNGATGIAAIDFEYQ